MRAGRSDHPCRNRRARTLRAASGSYWGAGASWSSLLSPNRSSMRRLLEAAAMHQIVECGTADAEQLSRLAVIAVDPPEHAQDRILLGLFAHAAQIEDWRFRIGGLQTDVGGAYRQGIGHDDGPLDHIFQFAHVAWPGVRLDCGNRVGQQRHRTP